MLLLTAGLVLFLGAHSLAIVAPNWRDRMVLHLGQPLWKAVYSFISAAGLALLLVGFAHARRAPAVLYVPPAWLHDLAFALMLPVFPLLLAAYLPGRIQSAAKHPLLAAVKFWASAHLLANGTLPDVLLFGSFLTWAGIARIALKTRAAAPTRRGTPSRVNDLVAVLAGLALYAWTVLRLHAWIIGKALL